MTVAYRADPRRGVVITVWEGAVTTALLRAHVEQRNGDPDWPGCRRCLLDATQADPPPLDDDHIRNAAAEYRAHTPKVARRRVAILARTSAHEYLLALQLALGPTDLVAVLFADINDACDWLRIDSDHAQETINQLRHEIRTSPPTRPHGGQRTLQ